MKRDNFGDGSVAYMKRFSLPDLEKHHRVPLDEAEAVHNNWWGHAANLDKERLQKIQLEQARQKLKQWKDKVSTQHGACRWLKQTEPVSCVLRDNQGNMITDRSALTQELRTCWSQIFGANAQSSDADNFWQTFGPYMPARAPSPVLPKITCADIQQAAQKMSKRATWLDGLAAQHISSLPQPALIRLAQLLLLFERKSCWPEGLKHWKVVFIPKQKQNSVPKAADVRPISVGPVIYRIWGQIRLRHCRHFLTSALSSHQAGGVGGPDVSSLLLSYDLEFPANENLCVAALDFTKAFDSCDFDLCLHVMQHLGLPDSSLVSYVTNGRNILGGSLLREVFTLHLYKEPKDCRSGTPGLP